MKCSAAGLRGLAVVAASLLHLLITAAAAAPQQQQQQQQQQPQQQQQTALGSASRQNYYGTLIGPLNGRGHNVSGEVYAVDEQTLFIRAFNYDGLAPDAYFWSSVSAHQPGAQDGFIVPDEKGSTKPLERYLDKDVVLRLPEGKTLREINWLSVWSRQTKTSSGEIMISRSLIIPRPLEIGPLSQLAHGLKSGPITIVDAQTFLLPDFHYDGLGPDAYFWLTRGSQGLTANGLRLKDENGSGQALRKYQGETVVITLPDELTIYDFDFFGVWCREFQVNFGQTRIPQNAKVPPSPKMLGIKPENKLNCEILYDDLGYEIRWVLDGDDIVMQLVGKIEPGEYMAFGLGKDDARSDMKNADAVVTWVDRQTGQVHAVDYFLGAKQQCSAPNSPDGATEPPSVSTSTAASNEAVAQFGSCPDAKLPGGGDSLTLLHGAIVNGYSMVTFKRPQLGIDELYDQHIYSDGQQSVLWAIGTLNGKKEIGYHRLRARQNMFIDFARNPQWNCPIPDLNASMHNNLPITSASQVDATVVGNPTPPVVIGGHQAAPPGRQQQQPIIPMSETRAKATAVAPANGDLGRLTGPSQGTSASEGQPNNEHWFIPAIACPPERTFYAQIGPTGARKGFEGVTGRSSWGVSWYVNGLMVPELVVERGQTYRFVVEGGNDKTSATRRHPFYLTDSPEGGFDFKPDEERMKERIFAGVALRSDGQFVPTAEGRLCEWKQTNATLANPDQYATFSAYQRSLKLDCLPGQASMLKFAPDSSTPDLIYYQCYTHRYMGWRIRVVNSCSAYLQQVNAAASAPVGVAVQAAAGGRAQLGNNSIKRANAIRGSLAPQKAGSLEWPPGNSKLVEKSTYNRRSLTEPLRSLQSEPRISFETLPSVGTTNFLSSSSEFADEAAGSSIMPPFSSTELSSITSDMLILNNSQLNQRQPMNLSSFDEILKLSPADLEFIDSQSPAGVPGDLSLEQYVASGGTFLPLHNFTGQSSSQPPVASQNKSATSATGKSAKTLHSYMRRLASIYYPVQQQLASILANQATPGGQNSASAGSGGLMQQQQQLPQRYQATGSRPGQIQAASTDQVSTFSLSNLVPKSKIDLTKSGISKKLSKLRFKTGRKYEPKPSQPPAPANEFNYDIFNNQLAQLEKQQKQFQTLELANWPQSSGSSAPGQMVMQQQQASDSAFNYLPTMAAGEEAQSIDSNNYQTAQQLLLSAAGQPFSGPVHPESNGMFTLPSSGNKAPGSKQNYLQQARYPQPQPQPQPQQQQQQQQQQYQQFASSGALLRQPVRLSETPLGPPNQFGQQPYVVDYLSMVFNRTADPPAQVNFNYEQQLAQGWPQANQGPERYNQQQQQPQGQYSQPSIYIKRLPQPPQGSFPFYPKLMQQQQQQPPQHQQQSSFLHDNRLWANLAPATQQSAGQTSARYPNIQPYVNQRPSQSAGAERQPSTGYRDSEQQAPYANGVKAGQMSTMPSVALSIHESQEGQANAGGPELESLSGSGSYYDFRQQPLEQLAVGGSQSPASKDQVAAAPGAGDQQAARGNSQALQQQQHSADLDHMMAIERFSKLPSERWPPSIVHPITGEQVHLSDKAMASSMGGQAHDEAGNDHHEHHHAPSSTLAPVNLSSASGSGATNQPRRFSAVLIDKHVVASNEPSIQMQSAAGNMNGGEILEADQSFQHASDLKRINVSDLKASHQQAAAKSTVPVGGASEGSAADKIQRMGSSSGQNATNRQQVASPASQFQHQQSTTESIPPVLVRPNNFDFFRDTAQPPASTTAATSTASSTLAPSTGPLTPSFGPPTVGSIRQATGNSPDESGGEIIIKSTLVDALAPSQQLIQSPSTDFPNNNNNNLGSNNYFNRPHLDPDPFTPIEFAGPLYYANQQQQQQQQMAASNLLTSRLRPPPLIESMLAQHQSSLYRPEPPVQVASYLAHHLASHNPSLFLDNSGASSTNQPTALSLSSSSSSLANNGQMSKNHPVNNRAMANGNSSGYNNINNTNDLIILKPAILAKQTPQTYLLKPEYLTNQFKLINDNSILGHSSSDPSAEFYYSNIGEASRRLSGHQFERLSSLSSPPSTSMALDPMQTATNIQSITSIVKNSPTSTTTNNMLKAQTDTSSAVESGASASTTKVALGNRQQQQSSSDSISNKLTNSAHQSRDNLTNVQELGAVGPGEKLAQHTHRQTPMPSKPIPLLNFDSDSASSSSADGVRLSLVGDNINMLHRDNNTDNAILSHVMSLISSNAIPTPPLIPVASYSSADYFLPSSDRTHRSIRG